MKQTETTVVFALALLTGCAVPPPPASTQHIGMFEPAKAPPAPAALRPVRLPALPAAPQPQAQQELFSVVVSEVPVKTLLFALARDNRLNVDIAPSVAGQVTLNATDQTLPQLFERIAQQADLRYEMSGNTVRMQRDTPYLAHYAVDYVNLKRQSSSQTSVSSQLSGSTAGSSNASISNAADNQFWDTLINNACLIIGAANLEFKQKDDQAQKQDRDRDRDERLRIAMELTRAAPASVSATGTTTTRSANNETSDVLKQVLGTKDAVDRVDCSSGSGASSGTSGSSSISSSSSSANNIVVNRETGQLSVYTTSRGHEQFRQFLDRISASARRQVLIEATIVEVTLSNASQQGVNWQKVVQGGLLRGLNFQMLPSGTGSFSGTQDASMLRMSYTSGSGDWSGILTLLESFGQARVLSSPKVSVLNNQTAALKVVDNYVYATIAFTPGTRTLSSAGQLVQTSPDTYTTNVNSVPVGFVMTVTPQVAESGEVTLNVRPTISRVVREIIDPNPALLGATPPIVNRLPVVQSRELESVLRVQSGEIAVLGGLMQDASNDGEDAVPGLSRIPLLGEAFKQKQQTRSKTELVVFLRPVVVGDASVNGDYKAFKPLLPTSSFFKDAAPEALGRKPLEAPPSR
ncbi:type II secretory pathway, component PulD [Polaromonas sp. CF318]|uniref:type II secretion system protein GspD n=1 Tax=Polaromonas sp. CF318 TaxID=1144318 RepID=UPI0002713505|nr:type II secretory pathway, component PulD [Polaromonas sp. CF318]EJL89926.1 type II secretory pathway, component PulD [Polaromonas sp. CF318]